MNYKQFQKQNHMSVGKIVLGVLAGFAAGAAIGILFAPEKGSATRKKILGIANDLAEDIKEKISESIKNVSNQFESTKDDLKDYVETGKSRVKDSYKNFN